MESANSKFRLAEYLDCYCGAYVFDESEHIAWNDWVGDKIKGAAENPVQDRRGKQNLSSIKYHSRVLAIFTANGCPIKKKPVLKRVIRIEFDSTKQMERADRTKRKEVDNKVWSLKPIGVRLVEHFLKEINYDINELHRRVELHGDKIVDLCSESIPKKYSWGLMYEGLLEWERVCKEYGVKWIAPSYEEFVKNVVAPIETTSYESVVIPYRAFLEWFDVYSHTPPGFSTQDVSWMLKILEVSVGKKIWGPVITISVLDTYNKENKENPIASLGDLARAISTDAGIPVKKLYKTWDFTGRLQKRVTGVFLYDHNNPDGIDFPKPDDEESEENT